MSKDYWIEGVFFTSGYAYTAVKDGNTVCLGNENDVLERINKETNGNLPVKSNTSSETKVRKAQGYRRSKARKVK